MTDGRPRRSKPVIGLSGGIGAGKSVVARLCEEFGAAVIDSDKLAHDELRQPDVVGTLRQWWGNGICRTDGSVDHKRVAAIVFEDGSQLARLEGLLYPRLAARRDVMLDRLDADPAVRAVVIDAPKLYEAGVDRLCDVVVFVDAHRADRVRRVAQSRRWSEDELARREKVQIALDIKRKNADYVVTNHAGIEELRPQVERVFSKILASFSERSA